MRYKVDLIETLFEIYKYSNDVDLNVEDLTYLLKLIEKDSTEDENLKEEYNRGWNDCQEKCLKEEKEMIKQLNAAQMQLSIYT
jgi:hypothetical protein